MIYINPYHLLALLSISIIVLVLYNIIKYIRKVIQGKNSTYDEFYLNHPVLNPNSTFEDKVLFHLEEMKDIAEKISEEKKELESCFSLDEMTGVLRTCCTFREQVRRELEDELKRNKTKYDQLHNTLCHLQKEVALYRTEVKSMTKTFTEPAVQEEPFIKPCKMVTESAVQTEESYRVFFEESSKLEISERTLLAMKDSVVSVAEEVEKEWLNEVLNALANLEIKYTDIKYLITSYWGDISSEISACGSIVDKVQKVEQTVFGILLFLQQQSFDAQTVRETLKFFDHKFDKFMKRSKSRWRMSNLKLDQTFEHVRKAQTVMDDSSSNFIENSMAVMQQLTGLEISVKDFIGVAKLVYEAERLTSSVERNVCSLATNMALVTAKIDGEYCRRLNLLSESLLKPGENLHVLFKSTEDLHMFAELMRNGNLNLDSSGSSVLSSLSETEIGQVGPIVISEAIGYGNVIPSDDINSPVMLQTQEQSCNSSNVDKSSRIVKNRSLEIIPPTINCNQPKQEASNENNHENGTQTGKSRPSKEEIREVATATRRASDLIKLTSE